MWVRDREHVAESHHRESYFGALCCRAALTTLVGGIHAVDFLVAPRDQDLDQSVFICACTLQDGSIKQIRNEPQTLNFF